MKKIAFLGATKGMGRSLARSLVEEGCELALLGRELEDLKASAADLMVRGNSTKAIHNNIPTIHCDLRKSTTFAPSIQEAKNALGGLDGVIITAGAFGTQEELENDPQKTEAMLDTNFTGTILLCEEARKELLRSGGGLLCVLSSVAGDRARGKVVLYGASKAGLSYYLEGLDYRYGKQGLKVLNVKPGFVHTSMTHGLEAPPFAGTPEQVATDIMKAMRKKRNIVYAPFMWRWVMLVIRNLPRFVMRRLSF